MRAKIILLFAAGFVLLSACQKKANTADQSVPVNYVIKISNKITEPTIIAGFYGKVLKYEGNFQPQISGDSTLTKQPEVSQTPILLYPFEDKEKIEELKYEEGGVTFYNLKALKDQGILPKYKFIPNKSGFYQMDLGNLQFCVLLELKGKRGYHNGGLGVITASHENLMELDFRVDYNATF